MVRIRWILIWMALLGLVGVALGQVLEIPKGQVEFIGLRSWTARQLYDKLVEVDPRNPLCMVGLDRLGFAASSVNKEFQGDRMFTLVIAVEPQFADRIKRRPLPLEGLPAVDRWADVLESVRLNLDDYMTALQLYDYHLSGQTETALLKYGAYLDPVTTKKIWADIAKFNDGKDKELAAWIIMNDKDVNHRIAAASVLANFHQSDSAWWALMEAMRYDDMVGAAAEGLLKSLSRTFPRNVDWAPMVVSIRALLDGTNPTHFFTTVRVLTQTRIAERFAEPLLSSGGSLLVDCLGASREQERAPVRQLLTRLAGEDLGPTPAAWTEWIATISKNRGS